MFVLLGLAVVAKKFTLLCGMFYAGQHKHAFPTSMDIHLPKSNAPGDAALSPGFEALNSELRPALNSRTTWSLQ